MKINTYYKALSLMFVAAALLSPQDSMAKSRTEHKIEKERRTIRTIKRQVHKENDHSKKQKLKQRLQEHQNVRDQLKAKNRENRNNALNNVAAGVGIVAGVAALVGL